MIFLRILALAIVLLPAITTFAAAAAGTTVILVRHAETVSDGSDDPGLSAEGRERAKALAAVAREANVAAIYATQYLRTHETAAEIASRVEIPIVAVAVERATIEQQCGELAKRILDQHAGQTVLVVGHSNTIPVIVRALSGAATEPIAHDEFDRLYIVVHEPGAASRVVVGRYGK